MRQAVEAAGAVGLALTIGVLAIAISTDSRKDFYNGVRDVSIILVALCTAAGAVVGLLWFWLAFVAWMFS